MLSVNWVNHFMERLGINLPEVQVGDPVGDQLEAIFDEIVERLLALEKKVEK